MFKFLFTFLFSLGVLLLPSVCFGASEVVEPADDTKIVTGTYANTNFGVSTTIYVGDDPLLDVSRGLIKFVMPAGSGTITKVQLLMYKNDQGSSNTTTIKIHEIQTHWDQGGATWNNRTGADPWSSGGAEGDYDTTAIESFDVQGYDNWVTVDLCGGTADNPLCRTWSGLDYTMIMIADNESAVGGTFWSNDYGTPALRPYLLITYTPPTVTQTVLGIELPELTYFINNYNYAIISVVSSFLFLAFLVALWQPIRALKKFNRRL